MSKKIGLQERLSSNIGALLLMIIPFFACFYLYGNFYNNVLFFPHRAGLTPFEADDWMYNSVLLFTTVGMIAIIGIAIWLINSSDKKKTGYWFTKRAFLVGILVYAIFMVTNPRFTIQVLPQAFGFTDIRGNTVANKDMYFYWIKTFGFRFVKYHPFQTMEDAIAGLEYAKETDDKVFYEYIFGDLERFGYENLLDAYKDVTFQAYLLDEFFGVGYGRGEYSYEKEAGERFFKNIGIFEKLKLFSESKKIVNISENILSIYDEYQKGKIDEVTLFERVNTLYHGNNNFYYTISGVNSKIF